MADEQVKEPETQPAPEPKEAEISSKSSDEIKSLLEGSEEVKQEQKKEPEKEPEKKEEEKQEEWFDKERGFKTKDDALKSYSEAQNKLRELAEEKKKYQTELEGLKAKAQERPLTQEEKDREQEVKKWEEENKDAIDFLEKRIEARLEKKKEQQSFEADAITARKTWKDEFDKDDSRKALWPVMENIYAKSNVMADFYKNPFPFIEAMAFKENFSNIAEQIRAEAVEQYKEKVKEAEEAERQNATGRPGGAKKIAGEVDTSKMSSSELAQLLPRSDEG